MSYVSRFGVPPDHQPEADALTRRLHDSGWASHVSVGRLLQEWEQLAGEVGDYELTIDDYTNDLTGRDALEQVLGWASPELRSFLGPRVKAADEQFRAATIEDNGEAVGRYFRIERSDGWWWRRRPSTGDLAAHLDRA